MTRRFRSLVAMLAVCLLLIPSLVAAHHQDEPNFTIAFLSRTYNSGTDTTTFTYEVTGQNFGHGLSHWVIGLCPERGGLPDPPTGVTGYKFDLDPAQEPNETVIYSLTLPGNVGTTMVPYGAKAGTFTWTGEVLGPACETPPEPAISVTKLCTPAVFTGDEITYTITVTNTGDVPLTDVVVEDSLLGTLPIGNLGPGESVTLNPTYVATAAGPLLNEVTASGQYGGITVTDEADCTTDVYDLTVEKTANPDWVRVYDWTVAKTAAPDSVTLDVGGSAAIDYTITATKSEASNSYSVSGSITITNHNPVTEAVIVSLADIADGVAAVISDCTFPLVIAAGGAATCDYVAENLPDASGENVATAANLNRLWDSTGTALAMVGTTDYSGSAAYHLDGPTQEIDAEAVVVDAGVDCPAGFTCTLSDAGPWTFTESDAVTATLTIDCGLTVSCGATFTITNVVVLTESDSGEERIASAVVTVATTACPHQGCTPGFWQGGNGSKLWNEMNDADWAARIGGANPYHHSMLFNSFFTAHSNLDGLTMKQLVESGGGRDPVRKAARSLVAAYLNASAGLSYPFDTDDLVRMWDEAIASNSFAELHELLDEANNLGCSL